MWNPILPKSITNEYQGYPIARILFYVITVITIIRSLLHIFLSDGGAGIIAGIDVAGENGTSVIALFALWGLSQLLVGTVFTIMCFRYKSLISFGYLLLIIEYFGRICLGLFKTLESSHTPPGEIGNYVMVPLAVIMLILSLKRK